MVVVTMREYMSSLKLHCTFGLLRRKKTPLTSLQSNVVRATSMLP